MAAAKSSSGGKGGNGKSAPAGKGQGKGNAQGKGKGDTKTNAQKKSDTRQQANPQYGPKNGKNGKNGDDPPPYDPAVYSGRPHTYLTPRQQAKLYSRVTREYHHNKIASKSLAEKTGGGGRLRPGMSALEKKIISIKVNKGDVDSTVAQYKNIVKALNPVRKSLKAELDQKRGAGDLIERFIQGIPDLANNLYGLTIGYLFAVAQNYRTMRRLKQDPDGTVLSFIVRGRGQNMGPGYLLGKSEMEQGRWPLHVKTDYRNGIANAAKNFFAQVAKTYKKAGIEKPNYRADVALGHSSGADTLRYASTLKEILESGIISIQGAAPSTYGMGDETLGVKLIKQLVDLSHEDPTTSKEAREAVIRTYSLDPLVHYEVVSGGRDELVRAEYAIDLGAEQMHLLPNETHFSTSGINYPVNKAMSNLMTDQRKRAISHRGHNYRRKAGPEYRADAA